MTGMVIGMLDLGGCEQCFNFALTRCCPKFLFLFRLRHTCSSSWDSGLSVDLSFFTSKSSAYSSTRNVSYFLLVRSFGPSISVLFS